MRKSPILDALFPQVRSKLLAATFSQPQREWYLSEVAQFIHTSPSSLQREIDSLAKAGILTQRRDGRRIYLKPDMDSPVFPELQRFFEKTAGLVSILSTQLQTFGDKIHLAFVYGSVARSAEVSSSDIDLIIIGDVGLAELVPTLREVERTLGRPVNPTVYSKDEFQTKARAGDHFITTVLAAETQLVKGGHDELEALIR